MAGANILLLTAASIALLHTLLGPDHYVPFAAMGKAQGWTLSKTLRVTFFCGLGHILSSVMIGIVGILLGAQLLTLVDIEGVRGNIAGWALLSFGLVYFAWGLKKAGRSREHSHVHAHGDLVHDHEHDHHDDHIHTHTENSKSAMTPWALFIVFILGPCEALIPLLMYPAAKQSTMLVFSVALVFGVVTLLTMLATVAAATVGIEKLRLPVSGRYSHALAGASVAICGAAVSFVGL